MTTPGPDLPEVMMRFCVVRLGNGTLFLNGGENYNSAMDMAQMYDFDTDSWQVLTSMGQARYNHGCARIPKGETVLGDCLKKGWHQIVVLYLQ